MDGFDLSSIDQEVFDAGASDSGECDELPLPDCIGIDSALQDDAEKKLFDEKKRRQNLTRTRTEEERDLELNILRPDSIRRQILEQSMTNGSKAGAPEHATTSNRPKPHVMNISEKAGMSGIDKNRINQIIHEASKGSLFYKRQAQRQAEIHKSIEKMLNRVKSSTQNQVEQAKITCDKLVENLEKQRVFNRIIVHFDLDMFFAAVEIRDNPALKDKPVAVGGESMVSTSNYIARKFGVRAAMPGFIAKKLCPGLLLIKPNGFKYREASSEVFGILEQYDPELTSMSLDEAYLDLTEYIRNTLERDDIEFQEYYDGTLPKIWWTRASEVVTEIRQAIYDKTKLTCSAGIACNTLLAKISTDINKPDGQFMVQGYQKDVIDFISKTPVEKVSGIGKVSAQFLNALDIKTCGDIYEKRHYLPLVFYEINVNFYLRVALGDGSTSIKSEEQRKSKSVERTFSAIKDPLILLDKLDNICDELCTKYLRPYRIRGRTVTVKLKRNTFMTTTKSYSLLVPTNDKLVIYSAAKNLLLSEIANEPAEISYRLLGVKLSNLADDGVTTNQLTIDAMLRNQQMGKSVKSEITVHQVEELVDEPESTGSDELFCEALTELPDVDVKPVISVPNSKPEAFSSAHIKPKTIESFFSRRGKACNDIPEKVADCETATSDIGRIGQSVQSPESSNLEQTNTADLNVVSQQEQLQNEPHDDDFQCPYCFKSYGDFNQLERHVEGCKMKIPIDVNRSFFSQRPLTMSQSSPSNTFLSQVKTRRGSNSTGGLKTRTVSKAARSVRKSSRVKKQPRLTPPTSPAHQTSVKLVINSPKASGSGRKPSFYERFLESNSQKLKNSLATEPFQCPFCLHGFITFSSLESHALMCTKK